MQLITSCCCQSRTELHPTWSYTADSGKVLVCYRQILLIAEPVLDSECLKDHIPASVILHTKHPHNISKSYPLPYLTRTPKVDYPHSTSLWVAQKDVLRFEVTVDDLDIRGGEEEQSGAQLLGKLACKVQRHSSEVGIAQQFVEIIREELKHKAEVVPIHKMSLHPNYKNRGKNL